MKPKKSDAAVLKASTTRIVFISNPPVITLLICNSAKMNWANSPCIADEISKHCGVFRISRQGFGGTLLRAFKDPRKFWMAFETETERNHFQRTSKTRGLCDCRVLQSAFRLNNPPCSSQNANLPKLGGCVFCRVRVNGTR